MLAWLLAYVKALALFQTSWFTSIAFYIFTLWFLRKIWRTLTARKFRLKDKNVLVTGGASGIGKSMVIEFLKRGANVVIWDYNKDGTDEAVRELNSRFPSKDEDKPRVYGYIVNVADQKLVAETAELTLEEAGPIHVICNNAGINFQIKDVRNEIPLLNTDMDCVRHTRVLDINLIAHFYILRAFLPSMRDLRESYVVATCSNSGLLGTPYMVAYSVSKFGVFGLMDAMRVSSKYYKQGVHFITLMPQYVKTPLIDEETLKKILFYLESTDVARATADSIQNRVNGVVFLPWTSRFPAFLARALNIANGRTTRMLLIFIDMIYVKFWFKPLQKLGLFRL